MFVNTKLSYNDAEGTVLEKFPFNFENCRDFANLHWSQPNFFEGVTKSQVGWLIGAAPCRPPHSISVPDPSNTSGYSLSKGFLEIR